MLALFKVLRVAVAAHKIVAATAATIVITVSVADFLRRRHNNTDWNQK